MRNAPQVCTNVNSAHLLSPKIMSLIFPLKETINYHSRNAFVTRNVHTVRYGTETLSHLGPKIWSIIPKNIRELKSLKQFKINIKLWKPDKCPCRLCKTYIPGVGFLT